MGNHDSHAREAGRSGVATAAPFSFQSVEFGEQFEDASEVPTINDRSTNQK